MGGARPDRRAFLGQAAGTAGLLLGGGCLAPGRADPTEPGSLIVRERSPENLEMPVFALNGFLTPTDLFYVRCHFDVPRLDAASWKLSVAGAVKKPLEFTYDGLQSLPSRTIPVTLECAGNGRSFLEPKAKGVQWSLGAVGTAEWTGVPLAAVLERAGIAAGAVDVVLEGADRGVPKNEPKPPGPLAFARGLPLAKALAPEVLLAYGMNGRPLTGRHGFPMRAVVAGWYGMASVKWLNRVVVTDRPFHGYDQTVDYAIWDRRDGVPSLTPITEIEVKTSIARPTAGEVLPALKDYTVRGAAWAGPADVSKVEISTDGGKAWRPARLTGKAVPFAWHLWEFDWKSPPAGRHDLMARATDSRGRSQPMSRDSDRRGYVINHVVPTPVEVRG
jgi:DMSO/TMAO reductase YedYZ molybdopterin-dependent catalytic subunit